MTEIWEFPQVLRTGYVDDDNGMYEIIPAADNATYSYWVEQLHISITEAAEGGTLGVVLLRFGDGTEWFEFNAHSTGVYQFDIGNDGYELCPKGEIGFQMVNANAETKQAKAWCMFRGHKRLQ
jgi:hypothetical protein